MADTKKFEAPSLTLEAPKDWLDLSNYILAGPIVEGFRTSLVVARNPAPQQPALEAYVEKQLGDLEKLPSFVLISRRAEKLGEFPALWLEYEWSQEKDKFIRQRQCHVWVEGQVYTMTVTGPGKGLEQVAALFEKVIASFKPKQWSG